jgi:hypothetical protein
MGARVIHWASTVVAFSFAVVAGATFTKWALRQNRVQIEALLYKHTNHLVEMMEARCDVCPQTKTGSERIKRVELAITSAGESHVRIQDSLALIRRDLNAQAELIAKERRQNGLAIDTLTTACQASVAACTSLSTQTERLLARIKET